MVLDYLDYNSENKYPFDDLCSVVSLTSYTLANDVLLDAQFYEKGDTTFKVALSNFENDIVGTKAIFTFKIRDTAGTLIDTVDVEVDHTGLVDRKLTLFEDADRVIKLITGAGLVRIVDAAMAIDEAFDEDDAKILVSCLVLPEPKVTSLKFYNNGTLFHTFTADGTSDLEVVIEEGTNTGFTLLSGVSTVDIVPGLGAGLYDPCGNDLVIKSVNGITPDEFGNFLLSADNCYTSEKGYQGDPDWVDNYGLTLLNICTPRCTGEMFTNFAHYLNRIKDGINTIYQEALNIAEELNDQIEDYNDNIANTKNLPYYKCVYTKFDSVGSFVYYSVVIGLFNPSQDDAAFTLAITPSGGTVVPGTIRWKIGTTSSLLGSLSYSSTVPCVSSGRFEFVIKAETTGSLDVDLTFGGTVMDFTKALN
jgi:hypothetical protein